MGSDLGTFLKAISSTKEPVLKKNEPLVAVYNPYVVNRCLSYFADCIHYVNEINRTPEVSFDMHFDFLSAAIRPRKRFSRTTKPDGPSDLEQILVCAFPGYSLSRIRSEIAPILEHDTELVETIKRKQQQQTNEQPK